MIKPDSTLVLNIADVNELYLVQISGLWGSLSLLHPHCSSSYIKTEGHCLRVCCKLVHKASTVTFSSTHIAWVINRQDQIKTKRKRRKNTFLLCQFCLPGNDSTTTSAVIALDLKLFHTLPTTWLWHHLTFGCLQLSRNIWKEFMSHVMKKFKLLWKSSCENKVNVEFFIELYTDWSIQRVWCWRLCFELEGHYIEEWGIVQNILSELYFVFCFITVPCLAVKIQIWRH